MTKTIPDKVAGAGPGYLFTILIALVVSAITATATMALYDQRFAHKVVVMDLKGFVRQQRDRMLSGELDEKQFQKNLDAMEKVLLAVPRNHTVIMKEVVLRNGREIRP